jgi:hypothetical protein
MGSLAWKRLQMTRRALLTVDAAINLALGVLLVLAWPYEGPLTRAFGVPPAEPPFYASILGAVLFGIGIALLLELRGAGRPAAFGLGLGGAIAINLCGGVVLGAWLIAGGLDLPLRGWIFLGMLDAALVAISAVELVANVR